MITVEDHVSQMEVPSHKTRAEDIKQKLDEIRNERKGKVTSVSVFPDQFSKTTLCVIVWTTEKGVKDE